jgi:hypothetical protein
MYRTRICSLKTRQPSTSSRQQQKRPLALQSSALRRRSVANGLRQWLQNSPLAAKWPRILPHGQSKNNAISRPCEPTLLQNLTIVQHKNSFRVGRRNAHESSRQII